MNDTATDDAPMVAHNQMLMAQITAHLRNGFDAALNDNPYYVIRNDSTAVLAVLASSTVSSDHAVVWGPDTFSACIQYVNSTVVTRMAETHAPAVDPVHGSRKRHRKPEKGEPS